jgi:hypothetical protein
MKMNWIEPIDIVQNGYYPLMAAEASAQIYRIPLGFDQEFLLIENRQPILWDSDIEGGGIVIYHVDDMSIDQSTRGYPGHPNWPLEHYMVSVLQADGKYDIEKGVNHGDSKDFYVKGMSLKPGTGDNWPNTDQIWTGTAVPTGITIEIMTKSQLIMMIRVTGIQESTPRVVNTSSSSSSSSSSTSNIVIDGNLRSAPTVDETTIPHEVGTQGRVRWVLSMFVGGAALLGLLTVLL